MQISFNSKLVRLKVDIPQTDFSRLDRRFNSKLVRLKAFDKSEDMLYFGDTFQFQTGAIKRLTNCPSARLIKKFQFQTGAIKSVTRQDSLLGMRAVSIPNWCD